LFESLPYGEIGGGRLLFLHPIFVRAGATGELQSLDQKVFGSLKQRAEGDLKTNSSAEEHKKSTIESAMKILFSGWTSITQDEIVAAWHPFHYED
jgi:hypothetical protein